MHDDQATAADYNDPMASKLLGTAADVLRSFGSAFGGRHLAIVGGTVPSLIAGRLPDGLRPHFGTADLDCWTLSGRKEQPHMSAVARC